MRIAFRSAEVVIGDEPFCTLGEIKAAQALVDANYPELVALLAPGHVWRDQKVEHGLLAEKIGGRILTELGFAPDDPNRSLLGFMARVNDLGRVIDTLDPRPSRFTGPHHGAHSARILQDWGIPECFANPGAREVLGYVVAHHADKKTPELPAQPLPLEVAMYVYTCFARDSDKAATFLRKTSLYLYDADEVRKQTEAMRRYQASFDPDNWTVTAAVLNTFCEQGIIARENVCTYPDYMLQFLAWLYDFNLPLFERVVVLAGPIGTLLGWLEEKVPQKQYAQIVTALNAHLATIWS